MIIFKIKSTKPNLRFLTSFQHHQFYDFVNILLKKIVKYCKTIKYKLII